jgi:hypothetical protein
VSEDQDEPIKPKSKFTTMQIVEMALAAAEHEALMKAKMRKQHFSKGACKTPSDKK